MGILLYIFTMRIITATAVTILGPTNKTYPEGSDITLICYGDTNGTLYWSRGAERQLLFYGNQRQTTSEKFENFDVKFASGYSNMSIKHTRIKDEGFYKCSLLESLASTYVGIEAKPELNLHLEKNDEYAVTNSDREMPQISVNCSAYGARPKVMIQFKVADGDWQPPSTGEVIPRDMLYDTTVLFRYKIPEHTENVTINCRTWGQISIPSMNKSLVLSLPICNLQIEGFNARCHCTAVPEVFMYKIKIGSQYVLAQEESLVSYGNSYVTCFGTNEIGTGVSSVMFFTNDADRTTVIIVVIVISMCVLLVAAIVAFIYRNTKRKRRPVDDSNKEASIQLMPKATKSDENQLKKEFQIFLSVLPIILTYDRWDVFASDILKISPKTLDTLRELHREKKDDFTLYKLLMEEIPKDDVDYMSKLLRYTLVEKLDLCKEFGMKLRKEGDMYYIDGMFSKENIRSTGKASKKACEALDKQYRIIRDEKQRQEEADNLKALLPDILQKDWEIFAIKILQMPVDKVITIKTTRDDLNDQIALVVEWFNANFQKETLQEQLCQEEQLCRKFGLNLVKTDTGFSINNFKVCSSVQEIVSPNRFFGILCGLVLLICAFVTTTLEKKKHTPIFSVYVCRQIDRLCKILNACGNFVGPVGAEIIRSALATIAETNTLAERLDTIKQFTNTLEQNFLFRVKEKVTVFQKLVEYEIDLVENLGNDWEVFAIKSMSLIPIDVQEIIQETKLEEEQTTRIMLKWEETVAEENEEETLKSWIKAVRGNTEKNMQTTNINSEEGFEEKIKTMNHDMGTHLPVDHYFQMLKSMGYLIGPIGASHMAGTYEAANEVPFVGSTYDMLSILLSKHHITNEQRTLELFKTRLHELHLFRAENLINSFLTRSQTSMPNADSKDKHTNHETEKIVND